MVQNHKPGHQEVYYVETENKSAKNNNSRQTPQQKYNQDVMNL